METNQFIPAIESLIFAAPQAIQKEDIKYCLENSQGLSIHMEEIESALEIIQLRYQSPDFGIELKEIGEGFQFLSKPDYFPLIADYIKINNRKKLTRAAMESLAIIAYKQPISKSEVEQIRGVNSDHSIQKLLEKELVEIKGRSEGPGKPILLGTSNRFMEYFGLKSLKDLPKLKDFAMPDQEIGEAPAIEETIELHSVFHKETSEDE
ncbi:MAG: SMC-Scp complex subunit ScpB [Saprospiraceae bacterium]|nr:SMC-Scp complex subunit ScpB [Saprospiraceae bacterium]MBK7810286.1 SMC-Scp complex subunit ScpB [Saprospiraceae bacterium]MBK9629889.1 SMC-Scp complex subunit ScpB [Saprospiraceae bacterium]